MGIAAVTVIVILFLYRGYQEATYAGFEFSRLVVIFGAAFATILLTGNRAIVDAIHAIFLKRGVGIRKVVVVGAGPVGQNIVSRLRKHYWLAYEPVAFVDDNLNTHGASVEGLQVMGGTDVLPRVAKAVGTNEVIVALPNSSQKSIRDIVGRCQSENLKIHILPDLFEVISSDVKFGAIDGVPVLDLDDHYLGRWDRLMKRGLDVMTVLVGATILLPVWALIAALIKLGSRGPVLFNQSRVGENGKTFDCIKFRTMGVITAEEEREERQRANRVARRRPRVNQTLPRRRRDSCSTAYVHTGRRAPGRRRRRPTALGARRVQRRAHGHGPHGLGRCDGLRGTANRARAAASRRAARPELAGDGPGRGRGVAVPAPANGPVRDRSAGTRSKRSRDAPGRACCRLVAATSGFPAPRPRRHPGPPDALRRAGPRRGRPTAR